MSEPNNNITPISNDSNVDTLLDELNEPDIQDDDSVPIKLTEDKTKDDKEDDEDEESEESDDNETDEDDELKKIEKDLEDEEKLKVDDDDENLDELVAPVKRSQILAKYPKLFKDFPYLEKAYFRNLQFTEIFSVPKEAKIAKEKSDAFDNFDQVLSNGDITQVLDAVKKTNESAFKKIADDYLMALGKVDPNAASHVTGNVIRYTIRAMINESQNSGDESLKAAAQLLNKFIFGTSEIKDPSRLTPQEDKENPEAKKLQQERQNLVTERYNNAVLDVGTKIENRIKATIDANIDPKEIMSDYVRSKAAEDVFKKVNELIGADKQFQQVKDRLWRRAYENGFSREALETIQSAFISKAKTLLPTVIKKAKIEALRGMGKRVKSDDSNTDKSPIKGGRPAGSSRNSNTTKEIPRGMSTLDFLNQD